MSKRKYEVSGTDDLADVHVFRGDDKERADVMRLLMAEI